MTESGTRIRLSGLFKGTVLPVTPFSHSLEFTIPQDDWVNIISAIDALPRPTLLGVAKDLLINHHSSAAGTFHLHVFRLVLPIS